MQVAVDILKVLIFPGLLFMAISGSLILLLEGSLRPLLYGGKSRALREVRSSIRLEYLPLEPLVLTVVSLLSLGLAGVLLFEMKANLFIVVLLLSAFEFIPVFSQIGLSQRQIAQIPLAFRAAFIRMITLFLVIACVSLRSPGAFLPELNGFTHSGAFRMLGLWSGYRYGLILAGLVLGLLSLLIFDLGDPAYVYAVKEESPRGIYLLMARGADRAITTLLFIFVFLGYPWEGWTGLAAWSGAVVGTIIALTIVRSWAQGRDRVSLRRWRSYAFLAALASLALALAAWW
jgi:hypothetical protein